MKLIEAIIMPVKLDEVRVALEKLGIEDFMESTLLCHGRQKGKEILYRGVKLVTNIVEKVKLEIIVNDDAVGKLVEIIGTVAKTEQSESCRIFILPFVEVS